MYMTSREVLLLQMLNNRNSNGRNTTHRDWFEDQCKRLSLDFDKTNVRFRNMGYIKRMSKKCAWPVSINIYKD